MARCQRLKIISLTVIGLGLSLDLLFLNANSFKETTLRFQDIFDITNLKTCFDNYLLSKQTIYKEFEDNINQTIVNTNTYLSTFNKEKALVIEDSLHAIVGAKNQGLYVIGVEDTANLSKLADIYELSDEEWKELYESLDWVKAIVVYINV